VRSAAEVVEEVVDLLGGVPGEVVPLGLVDPFYVEPDALASKREPRSQQGRSC